MRCSTRTVSALAVMVLVAAPACGTRATTPAPPATSPPPVAAPATPAGEYAAGIAGMVRRDALMDRLRTLQDIADANGGNRALGSKGYAASVDYVADTLRDKGFDVTTDEFEVNLPFADEPKVSVDGREVKAAPLLYTVGTPAGGIDARLVPARAEETPGCKPADYDGLDVSGAVVLVDRGACPFGDKQAAAAERGAVALIVANNEEGQAHGGTLGEDTDVKIPVVAISQADGARLRAEPGETRMTMNAGVRRELTRNVIAQTRTGSTHDVVMLGAHLDSVADGPGINDNGSGTAAVLETAMQLGPTPPVRNAVRFAFWGAEEEGLVGSANYIATLDEEELKDIAMYLNFDMLGSPNPGYFTYDGDQSTRADSVPRVPEGSAGIERTFVAYLDGAGKTARDTTFDGRSDYDAFTNAGIPAGGLFSGAEEKMTDEEAQLWGGDAGQPFDPNYHKASDTIDDIDADALEIHSRGVAFSVAYYAQDQSGRNGVPVRDDRTRHPVENP